MARAHPAVRCGVLGVRQIVCTFDKVLYGHAGSGEDCFDVLPTLVRLALDVRRHAAVRRIADLASDIEPSGIGWHFDGMAIGTEWSRDSRRIVRLERSSSPLSVGARNANDGSCGSAEC